MEKSNFDIRLKNHYKLYVLLKDKLIFESELQKNGIKYYYDIDEQPFIDSGIRYFLLDSDRKTVDRILISNSIIATIESLPITDYKDNKKMMKIFLLIALIIIAIILFIDLF